MVKDDLIYDWKNTESHLGYKLLAILVVAGVFVGVASLVDVKIGERTGGVLNTAAILRFSDDELGRFWELKAEEGGPFPGRMEIPSLEVNLLSELTDVSDWNTYEITPESLISSEGIPEVEIARKGVRYFPERKNVERIETGDSAKPSAGTDLTKVVVLIPSDREGLDAIPEELPDFGVSLGVNANPALWRFLVSLRADGTVDHCVSLVGETDETLDEVMDWLRTVQFNEGEEGRWLGLQMEFVRKEQE